MIVTPYEQHVARSFYWDLINEKNEEKKMKKIDLLFIFVFFFVVDYSKRSHFSF
jgi:hypothetical protein